MELSCDQDFEPSGFGKTRGFSVDDFDMEVSAACFGGSGGDDEDAWASMTLWNRHEKWGHLRTLPTVALKMDTESNHYSFSDHHRYFPNGIDQRR